MARTQCNWLWLFSLATITTVTATRVLKESDDSKGNATITTTEKTVATLVEAMRLLRSENHVMMGEEEQGLIESYLKPTDVMLEWGMGYSTLWFSQFVKEYYSIEHNKEWFQDVQQLVTNDSNIHLHLAAVDSGYKGWGGHFEEGTKEQFEKYIDMVHELGVQEFDKVLIDGRARADCAMAVLKYLRPSSIVFIHDYFPRFKYHDTVQQHYDRVAGILSTTTGMDKNGRQYHQTLVVLKRKENDN